VFVHISAVETLLKAVARRDVDMVAAWSGAGGLKQPTRTR